MVFLRPKPPISQKIPDILYWNPLGFKKNIFSYLKSLYIKLDIHLSEVEH
ncbi:hypothetical protein LEP1GSC017_2931 [Leptospira meyeri serovar Hardjo str. Went 5]|nr:hypothetical protein LEP1GSC017_2931 [Leptospira meyeri serovar Hardjo str. Went 5]